MTSIRRRPVAPRLAFAALLAGVGVLALAACTQEGPAAPRDMASGAEPVLMFNTLPVRAQALDGFLPVMRANVAASRQEAGNLSFDVYQREEGGSDLFLFERWESPAALDAHMQTPHLRAVADAASTALGEPEQSVRLREISEPAPWREPSDAATTRNLIVSLSVRPERREEFVAALLGTVAPSRAAPGNLVFDVYEDVNDPNTLVILERWTSVVAHEAHLTQPYNEPLNAIFEQSLAAPLAEGRRLLRDVSAPQGGQP